MIKYFLCAFTLITAFVMAMEEKKVADAATDTKATPIDHIMPAYQITRPGKYKLTIPAKLSSISPEGGIVIDSDEVDLNLHGMGIDPLESFHYAPMSAITISAGRRNITIRNGAICDFYRGHAILVNGTTEKPCDNLTLKQLFFHKNLYAVQAKNTKNSFIEFCAFLACKHIQFGGNLTNKKYLLVSGADMDFLSKPDSNATE